MKTPITYYGGKQKLASKIVSMIPEHNLYCEPFIGGAAVFFAKNPSPVEVINDTNSELINFYEVVKNDFSALHQKVRISLHSRTMFEDANHIIARPHMFTRIDRAWAIWCLAAQGFSGMLDGKSWGYDVAKNTTTKKIINKRDLFDEDYAIRLQNVQIECTDALRIIRSRDAKTSFFYCDPPYYNSDCGHYDGYSLDDFENLLKLLSQIEGKFLLSSYPSPILAKYKKEFGWHQIQVEQRVSVNKGAGKQKIEVMTSNYPLPILEPQKAI